MVCKFVYSCGGLGGSSLVLVWGFLSRYGDIFLLDCGEGASSLLVISNGTFSRYELKEYTLIVARDILFCCGVLASSLLIAGGLCLAVMCWCGDQ